MPPANAPMTDLSKTERDLISACDCILTPFGADRKGFEHFGDVGISGLGEGCWASSDREEEAKRRLFVL